MSVSSTSSNSNTMRVTGLASGMNTDEIVANLVKVQSARLEKMQQSKTLATWKQDAYRDVNTQVNTFLKSMESLRLQSTFNKQTASSSNESVISATVSGTPKQTSYTITGAQQAQPAVASSVKFFEVSLDTTTAIGTAGTLNINETSIEFTADDTLSTIMDKIKTETAKANNGKAVTVAYSATEKSLTFTNVNTGDQNLTISGTPALLSKLGIPAEAIADTGSDIENVVLDTVNPNMSVVSGSDATQAKMWINGLEFRSDTNSITYDGMTFDIKGKSTDTVSVTTKSDTDSIVDSIKTFVDKYNELIANLNGKLTEEKYRDYQPLLDDQKEDMSENDIKLWEDKAKSGLLSRDSTISSLLTEMRNSLVTSVQGSGAFKSLKEIGIDFSSSYADNGKLILDEEKLKGALKTNLEDVKSLFTDKGTSSNSSATTATDKTMHSQSGFGWRIYERLNVTIKQLSSIAGSPGVTTDTSSSLAKQIKTLNSNISNEQDRVDSYEDRLWAQFGAMEKAIQQMNSQSSWLSQQFSS